MPGLFGENRDRGFGELEDNRTVGGNGIAHHSGVDEFATVIVAEGGLFGGPPLIEGHGVGIAFLGVDDDLLVTGRLAVMR